MVSDCEELVGGTHLVKSDAFPIYHSPRKTAYPPGCVNFIVRCREYWTFRWFDNSFSN